MAIDFENPLTAGTVLVREAIQSQNYNPGASGWQVAADGTAEFSDLTIRSSDGTNSTVTVANGQIAIEDGAGVEVIQIDADGYRFYSSSGSLLADIRKDTTTSSLAGIYTRNFAFPSNTYGFFAGGEAIFGPVLDDEADDHGFIQYAIAPTSYVVMTMSTGRISSATDDPVRIQLISEQGQRPRAYVDGGSSVDEADLHVVGYAYGGNVPFVQQTTTTTITNDTTFTSDPGLQVELEANSSYDVEFFISYGTTAAAGFRTQWAAPIGTQGNKGVQGLGSGATGANADNQLMRSGIHNLTTNIEYGNRGSSGSFCFAQEKALIRTDAVGGTLALQWSQLSSSADQTIVSSDSFLRISKVG